MTFDELRPELLRRTSLAIFVSGSDFDPALLEGASLEGLRDERVVSSAAWERLEAVAIFRFGLCGMDQHEDPILQAVGTAGGEEGPVCNAIRSLQGLLVEMVSQMLKACQK
jgi:hypothetical protein